MNYIRGGDAIRSLVEQCCLTYNLQKPQLIKSTQLRKHVSTIAQILVLNEGELSHMSNHMGHSKEIHKTFYRLQESTVEKTHITKLLQLVNTGNIAKYKGKTLNDINLEDLINAATDDINLEQNDEDVDGDLDNFNDEVDELSSSTTTSNVYKDNELVNAKFQHFE